jgi:hypothetical protein
MDDLIFLKGTGTEPEAAGDEESRLIEDLRHDAASALERGLGFMKRHASELALLRTHVMLGAEPAEALVTRVEALQRRDGAFMPLGLAEGGAAGLVQEREQGMSEPLLGTLEALIVLSDASALASDCIEGAARFARAQQLPDGSWGPADRKGADRLFATGLLAGTLGRTRVVRPDVLESAGEFMGTLWDPDLVEDRDGCRLAAFACFFSSVSHDLSDGALQWIGRELEKGFRSRTIDAPATLRVLLHCDASAVPGARLDAIELLRQTLDEQGPDGGFAELSSGGPLARVEPTFDCMLGIIRLCGTL